MRNLLLLSIAMGLSACATMSVGTNQQITVNSEPSAARCELIREGVQVGIVSSTPNIILVERSSSDITVICSKDGWGNGAEVLVSQENKGATAANVIGTLGIGLLVDGATGALFSYPPSIMVALPPLD